MKEEIRHLLEECQTLNNTIQKQIIKYEETEYDDTNTALLHARAILIPLEINIRKKELKLKQLKIQLKNTEEYEQYKTLKAKEEQTTTDTIQIQEAILDLKLTRNKIRTTTSHLDYKIQQELIHKMNK